MSQQEMDRKGEQGGDRNDFGAIEVRVDLLGKSGGTLSMVTSKFPRITGSLAIFSGLGEQSKTSSR